MKHTRHLSTLLLASALLCGMLSPAAAQQRIGDFIESTSYYDTAPNVVRHQQYVPEDGAFVSQSTLDDVVNKRVGHNRFTRALYGSHSDWRLETSDRPVFAIVKKGAHRSLRFSINSVMLDSVGYCKSAYKDGQRTYLLQDERWGSSSRVTIGVVCLPDEEGALLLFTTSGFAESPAIEARMCGIANPKLHRNGDIGADPPGVFEPSPTEEGLTTWQWSGEGSSFFVIENINQGRVATYSEAADLYDSAVKHYEALASRVVFKTPDPYINTLGSALVMAADGDWDGTTWLHGCIGWRMPLAGWRAAYVGDVLGWKDRAVSHFDAYAKSQVTEVPATIPHPTNDTLMNLARAEKRWGTPMYSNGYICRNPGRNDQMHHYDMNLNYIDELLWHFQYDADTTYMRRLWPVIERHLAWEKSNFDPDGDHLYDAYCCIWASDALYYNGGAVTHSSAYNYRANRLAAQIARLIGLDGSRYDAEADAIRKALNDRLWLSDKGVWAEYQDKMGLQRVHTAPAVWSIYTPIDCDAATPEQAWRAIDYLDDVLVMKQQQFPVLATTNWLPYSWSINNVASAETMHTALACFEAGRNKEGYQLLMGNILDQMYFGQSPANFGQISFFDAARGECYRDFGDCIGISSRTLIEGLFGIVPQALYGRCLIQPAFPDEWQSCEVSTPHINYIYAREGRELTITIDQHFATPLKLVYRHSLGNGKWIEVEGTSDASQTFTVVLPPDEAPLARHDSDEGPSLSALGLSWQGEEQAKTMKFRKLKMQPLFNASVSDIFRQRYLSPRPDVTTLEIPVQGIGEWCHPQLTAEISDSVFRSMARGNEFVVAGVPFTTPQSGKNILFTSLWDNYPDSIALPLSGRASMLHLLLAGTTNHMQSRIDNAIVVVTYADATTDTLRLRNPENWCPIEQDYYVDDLQFSAAPLRPWRVCFGNGVVSRDLGKALNIKGVYGREIPGGAAQMLSMPLDGSKKLRSLTLRTLSNDVVVGLMGVTLSSEK